MLSLSRWCSIPCVSAFLHLVASVAGSEPRFDVGNRKQLFIDTRFIAQSERVQLRMNAAQKLGRILDETHRPIEVSGHTSRVLDLHGRVQLYVGAGDLILHCYKI